MDASPHLIGAALLAVSLLAVAPARGEEKIFPFPVAEKRLANGLTVVVVPYDSPGTVATMTVVRTGSRDEVERGHSGFAHFFEHMMFRGTPRYSADAYNDELKRMGADSNAFTDDDLTLYYIVGPARALPKMLEIEADRFQNLRYSEEAFKTEAFAVLGEYNKNASSPFLPMFEKLREIAYDRHTYEHTTMGFLDDIRAMPTYYDYSLKFFDRFYRPENCILLLVGDVDPERAFALAEREYGGWKPGYQAPRIEPEPPQRAERRAALSWPSPTRPYLMIGFHAPAFSTAGVDMAAIELAGSLLFSESAPLYQELVVEKQWVDQLSGGLEFHRDPYLFTVVARVRANDLLPQVEAAIYRAMADLAAAPVEAARLARVQSNLRYAMALGLNSPGAVGFRLANFLQLTGRVAAINEHFARLAEATPADVTRLAKQLFRPEVRNVVTLQHTADAAAPRGGN